MSRTYLDRSLDDPRTPAAGDVLESTSPVKGITSWHRILDAWPTESRVWPNRWTLVLGDRSASRLVPDAGKAIIPCNTYLRGEGPADYFGGSE